MGNLKKKTNFYVKLWGFYRNFNYFNEFSWFYRFSLQKFKVLVGTLSKGWKINQICNEKVKNFIKTLKYDEVSIKYSYLDRNFSRNFTQ